MAGGAVVLVGQAAFSQFADADTDAPTLAASDAPSGPGAPTGLDESVGSTPTPLLAAAPAGAGRHRGFEPVALDGYPQQADADSLIKAAGLVEAARSAERQAQSARTETAARAEAAARVADEPTVRGSRCAPDRSGFGAVKSWVSGAGTALRCIFDIDTVGGVAGRAGTSDHPSGLALDFMVKGNAGDKLAEYALRYRDQLKIKYVIWEQRINFGSGWKGMEDRGSVTANHFDHVHISFDTR